MGIQWCLHRVWLAHLMLLNGPEVAVIVRLVRCDEGSPPRSRVLNPPERGGMRVAQNGQLSSVLRNDCPSSLSKMNPFVRRGAGSRPDIAYRSHHL